MKPCKSVAFALMVFAAQTQAYFIDTGASELNGNDVVDFSESDSISLDANFLSGAPIVLRVQRGPEDIESPVSVSAVVNNFTGFSWSSFSVQVTDNASLNAIGDVFAFTALENVSSTLNDGVGVITFGIGEAAGFELGNVFGDFGVAPWLIDVSGVDSGDGFGIELNPSVVATAVSAPTTGWLLGSAIFGFGALRRRR